MSLRLVPVIVIGLCLCLAGGAVAPGDVVIKYRTRTELDIGDTTVLNRLPGLAKLLTTLAPIVMPRHPALLDAIQSATSGSTHRTTRDATVTFRGDSYRMRVDEGPRSFILRIVSNEPENLRRRLEGRTDLLPGTDAEYIVLDHEKKIAVTHTDLRALEQFTADFLGLGGTEIRVYDDRTPTTLLGTTAWSYRIEVTPTGWPELDAFGGLVKITSKSQLLIAKDIEAAATVADFFKKLDRNTLPSDGVFTGMMDVMAYVGRLGVPLVWNEDFVILVAEYPIIRSFTESAVLSLPDVSGTFDDTVPPGFRVLTAAEAGVPVVPPGPPRCDCTCVGYQEVKRLSDSRDPGERARAMAQAPCVRQCAVKWAGCRVAASRPPAR